MFPYHAVGGTGAGAARARCGWRLIRRSRYRRTLATFLAALTERLLRHPARILVSSARLPSPSPGTRLASTTTTQLASLTAATAHLLEKRMLHMRLLHAYRVLQTDAPSRCSHAHGPSIPGPGSPAAAQAVEPCACPSSAPQVCRLRPKGHACRRTPLLRVNRADAAALAAPPHACSDYACPPVVAPRMHNSNQSESER